MLPGESTTGSPPDIYIDGKRSLMARQYNHPSGMLVTKAEGGPHILKVIL